MPASLFVGGRYQRMMLADKFFCSKFQTLYDGDSMTMNMHLRLHIVKSILDYGTVYSYCVFFSFVLFNGILGTISTKNHSVGVQLKKRFVSDQFLHADEVIHPLKEYNMHEILAEYKKVKGSVAQQLCTENAGNYQHLGPI